ncbi:hypothetical protein OUZ56_031635 [Daphnia magna]|uniref:Uncharacterized protein n=1 Tax=Daphnia magna TaxID=35525 RepID=A0ABQ9ZUS8_9CRUS|nr:hypothetical protein OUZ56_031635 [Daphnia magna]
MANKNGNQNLLRLRVAAEERKPRLPAAEVRIELSSTSAVSRVLVYISCSYRLRQFGPYTRKA